MATEQAGFKTSMFGFCKTDVLACIDRISAENLAAQEQATVKMAALEESLAVMHNEKVGLVKQVEEKDAALGVLQQALVDQTSIANEATTQVSELSQALKKAETSAHDYKSRLFTREGEATVLRRDNTRLTESLSEKQKEIALASEQVIDAKKTAAQEIEAVRSAAAQKIAAEAQRIKLENEAVQEKMKASATNMAQDVVALKQALSDLDQKIGDSLRDLQHSTARLSQTLETTEDSVLGLGVKLAQFPEVPPAKAAHKPAQPCATKPVVRCVKRKAKPQTISALLLTQIAKMIGEE